MRSGEAPRACRRSPSARERSAGQLRLQPASRWDRKFWDSGWQPGEEGAQELLQAFVEGAAHGYAGSASCPTASGSSRLFAAPAFRRAFAAAGAGCGAGGAASARSGGGPARFATELGWREFAVQTLLDNPLVAERDLDPGFRHFAWARPDPAKLRAWQRGHTGVPLVDAGMRELWATGWMHNRVRMVAASFLCKNLRYHWRHGASWFWQTLLDADLSSNTQGWQWTAGTGVDAAPYFRVFSPPRQAERFDPRGDYVRRWVPELAALPAKALYAPWEHAAEVRRLAPDYPPAPVVDLARSRQEALDALPPARRKAAEGRLVPGGQGVHDAATRVDLSHRLPVRIMHWTNVVCLFVLIGSGLQIFIAHPALYWGDDSEFSSPALSLTGKPGADGKLRGTTQVGTLRFDSTGVLGVSENLMGKPAVRAFPTWATIPGAKNLAQGRRWHFFFAWIFVINGLLYWLWSWRARHLRDDLLPTRRKCAASAPRSSSTRNSTIPPASRPRATTCCRSWPTWR
jgi:hypothetical protein